MRKKIILTILFIVLFLIGFCGIVLGEDLSNLQTQRDELQNQINESNEQMQEIQIELTENLEQLNNLNMKPKYYL